MSKSFSIQVLDLSHISPELAYAAEDADLVVMEGMVRRRSHGSLSSVLNNVSHYVHETCQQLIR